jgi:N-acylneuraminate cytidylyltransferase
LECIEVDVENIILLQCTNPLRPDNLLKEALKYIKEPSAIVYLLLREIMKLENN